MLVRFSRLGSDPLPLVFEDTLRGRVAREPDSAHHVFQLGSLLLARGKPGEAALFLRRAVALNPRAPFFHAKLAQALEDLDRWEQSLSHREIAARLQPDVPVFHYRLGLTLGILGRFEEASRTFETAVALEPLYYGAHAALGTVYRGLGRLREAVVAFECCDAICPEYLDSRPDVREAWRDARTRLRAGGAKVGINAPAPTPAPDLSSP